MLDDPDICFKLKVELAALVDAGEVLVKTCYFLEGDGYVALKAYDRMKAVDHRGTQTQWCKLNNLKNG